MYSYTYTEEIKIFYHTFKSFNVDISLVLQNGIEFGSRYLKLNNGQFHYDEHIFKGQKKD